MGGCMVDWKLFVWKAMVFFSTNSFLFSLGMMDGLVDPRKSSSLYLRLLRLAYTLEEGCWLLYEEWINQYYPTVVVVNGRSDSGETCLRHESNNVPSVVKSTRWVPVTL
jgi:hypothetical protein